MQFFAASARELAKLCGAELPSSALFCLIAALGSRSNPDLAAASGFAELPDGRTLRFRRVGEETSGGAWRGRFRKKSPARVPADSSG